MNKYKRTARVGFTSILIRPVCVILNLILSNFNKNHILRISSEIEEMGFYETFRGFYFIHQ